jgi:hypothetical protein
MRWFVALTIVTTIAASIDSTCTSQSSPQPQCGHEILTKIETQTQKPEPGLVDGFHVIVFDENHRYEGHLLYGRYHGLGVEITKEGTYDGKASE